MQNSNANDDGDTARQPVFKENPKEEIKQWLFFTDRPVTANAKDTIWTGDDDLVQRQLRDIQQHLVRALSDLSGSDDNVANGLTFAVFGEWGAGKTSFLRMLNEQCSKVDKDRIVVCDYVASSYAYLDVDARLPMIMNVLHKLKMDLADFYRSSDRHSQGNGGPDAVRMHEATRDLQELANKLTALVDFPSFLSEILGGTESNNWSRRILVVLIDDLDRCPIEFVVRIIKITQEWAGVSNLFFVLAINREWLSKAIKTLGGLESEGESDYAVEKYVQHTVILPPLEDKRLENYIMSLLSDYADRVSRTLASNTIYIQKGLRFKTPRAVKRLLNFIRPYLRSQLEREDPVGDTRTRLLIKELVLRYSWPEFYGSLFKRSVKGRPHRKYQVAFSELEAACCAYDSEAHDLNQDPDDEKLGFSLHRIGEKFQIANLKSQIPTDLVYFLAQEPYWAYKPVAAEATNYGSSIPKKSTGFDFEVDLDHKDTDIDDQFMQLYLTGRAEADRAHQLEFYAQAAQFAVDHQDELPHHRADEIGNMALDAESHRSYVLADNLYRLALALNADHPNNIQNYVSFILDSKRQSSFDDAKRYLDELDANYSDFKPDRLLQLKAQYANDMGQPVEIPADKIEQLIAEVAINPADYRTWGRAMVIVGRYMHDYNLMRRLLAIACAKEYAESKEYIYRRLRGFADQIGGQVELRAKRRDAMEIYRRLLLEPNGYVLGTKDEADVRHNYAALLYGLDFDDEAGRMWHVAYQLSPDNRSIKTSYSTYLIQANRQDLVNTIMEGKPINEMVLLPENVPLPTQFSAEPFIEEAFKLMDELP